MACKEELKADGRVLVTPLWRLAFCMAGFQPCNLEAIKQELMAGFVAWNKDDWWWEPFAAPGNLRASIDGRSFRPEIDIDDASDGDDRLVYPFMDALARAIWKANGDRFCHFSWEIGIIPEHYNNYWEEDYQRMTGEEGDEDGFYD